MPSYHDVVFKATRTVSVIAYGLTFTIEEHLLRDPKLAKARRKSLLEAVEALRQAIREAEAAAQADQSAKPDSSGKPDDLTPAQQTALFRAQLAQVEAQLPVDERMLTCEAVENRIAAWDVELNGVVAPLKAAQLYETEVATEFLQTLLEQLEAAPIVPEASA